MSIIIDQILAMHVLKTMTELSANPGLIDVVLVSLLTVNILHILS